MRLVGLSEAEFDRRWAVEMAQRDRELRAAQGRESEARAATQRMVDHALETLQQVAALREQVERLASEQAAWRLAAETPVAAPVLPPALPCTCGSVHFTAGGQAVTPRTDGRVYPDGAVLSCLRCGRRWGHCGHELIEPHEKALPPAWAAVDLHARVQESQLGPARNGAEFRKVREATRRASDSLRPPPRRGA